MGGGARGAKGYRALDVGWAILFSRAGLLTDLHTKVDFPVQAMAWRRSPPYFPVRFHLRSAWKQKGMASRKIFPVVVNTLVN